jgi:histidine kinase
MVRPIILCVDDEIVVLETLKQELEFKLGTNFSFLIAESGEEALEIAKGVVETHKEMPVVISDQLMPGIKGDEFLVRLHQIMPETRSILLTGQASTESVGRALNQAQLFRYISKPWEETDLMMTVEQAINSYNLKKEVQNQIQTLQSLNTSAKVLAEEIQLSNLMHKIIEISLSETRATSAWLWLNDHFFSYDPVLGIYPEGESIQIVPVEGHPALPLTIVEQCRDEAQVLNVNMAHKDKKWNDDPYITQHSIRSLYAAPLLKGGQVLAVLFLAHNVNGRHFESTRAHYLDLFCSQATTAIDNALLYEGLEQKVRERTDTIERQKQDILDSIHYAQRIQNSMLPDSGFLRNIFPESFIYFRPKDIISGDFYWLSQSGEKYYLVVADCTGHGVPGAMLAMFGINVLNQIIKENPNAGTSNILLALYNYFEERLNQHKAETIAEDDMVNDGMELSVIVVDPTERKIEIGGANRPVYLFRNQEIVEFKTTRSGIGRDVMQKKAFNDAQSTVIDYQTGDTFYLFSDGMVDQFGGPLNKRYSTKRFKELLTSLQTQPLSQQYRAIVEDFSQWMDGQPQTDDMALIGIRLA